jgi:nitroreductase
MADSDSHDATPVTRRTFVKSIIASATGIAVTPVLVSGAFAADTTSSDPGLFATIYSLRSMRRLKPDPIPEETLKKIIDAGIHAPNGGNRQDWAFILVRDPALKRFIRDRYWENFQKVQAGATPFTDMPPERQRLFKASTYMAEHLHEVPVILLPCVAKRYKNWAHMNNTRGDAVTMHGSIYPAVQNILLACRAFGIGATMTSIHVFFENELKQKLGVPESMEIATLVPMGYPKGKLGPIKRKPVEEVLFWDRWDNKKS